MDCTQCKRTYCAIEIRLVADRIILQGNLIGDTLYKIVLISNLAHVFKYTVFSVFRCVFVFYYDRVFIYKTEKYESITLCH